MKSIVKFAPFRRRLKTSGGTCGHFGRKQRGTLVHVGRKQKGYIGTNG